MRQACFQGLIDPCKANLLDRKWWWRLQRVFDYLEGRNQIDVLRLIHDRHCGAIDYTTEQTTFEHHWNWAGKIQSMVSGILLPWVPIADKAQQIKAMSDAWEKQFGSYKDPEVRAKVAAACDKMEQIAAQGRKRKGRHGR